MLRDRRAVFDTTAGPVVFVLVYAIFGINAGAAAAIGLAVVLIIERLIRRKPVVNAVGGLFGTAIAAFIAVRTGRPEGFFLPRMLIQVGYALVFAGSVVIRRPIAGYIVAALYRAEHGWRDIPGVRRTMSEVTLAWAALFAIRSVVYGVLIATGEVGWLTAAWIAMGYPAFGLLLFISYRYVPRRLEQLGAPSPRHEAPEPRP
jgi:hypothetical protein